MSVLLPNDPQQMGPYRLTARLGAGGMGMVYLGRSRTGREVAVKVVRPELADEPGFRDRFRREVSLAMKVGGFWTAAVVDTDPDCPTPWVASQYVAGPSLSAAFHDRGPMNEATLRFLGAGLAEALAAIHSIGLVHRDVKPANVLLAHDGPRVIDFGISKALDSASGLTRTGTTLGTPGYMSPEQATGEVIGPPSDIFSLGSVLTFAAVGAGPFGEGQTHALLYRVVHSEPQLSAVPAVLRPTIEACLSKDPEQRPSATQVLDALDVRAADGPPPGWPNAAVRPPAPVPLRKEPPTTHDATAWDAAEPPPVPVSQYPTRIAPSYKPTVHEQSTTITPGPRADPGSFTASAPLFDDFADSWRPYGRLLLLLLLGGVASEAAHQTQLVALLIKLILLIAGIGLVISLPHLAGQKLRVNEKGLKITRAGRTIEPRWSDVAYVTMLVSGTKTLSLVVVLRKEARISIPRMLRGKNSGGARECTFRMRPRSPAQGAIVSAQLHAMLLRHAGGRYVPPMTAT
ncbi:serine/threonine protein kinase [Streptomyces sp. H39-S7]|uniref:serine/threonine protein kinase n=1 Tax=Streptomyces sp. H39-S7 TaxID=3004357 RepID=UPI0022AFE232|nr:serine/threonine protein kinase [Streptomyces sp. H39-S7]MCZ4122741.1 protein kinase [Streptomyces sp. H39-S7]